MGQVLFTARSPLGYIVNCSQSQWDNHIVTHHPVMAGKEHMVKNAIENPIAVYPSDESDKRDVYFGDYGNTNNKVLFTKVIVDVEATGAVITAFPQKDISGNIDKEVIKYVKTKL